MDRKAGSNEFRNNLEERLGTKEYDRISSEGQQDPRKGGRYSAAEVISEFRERPKGTSVNEGDNSMVSKYQGMVDGGSKFNNKAKAYLTSQGVNFNSKSKSKEPSSEPSGSNAGSATAGDNSIASPISQANPIEIDGNSNQVNQDNSIKQTQNYDYSIDNSKVLNDNSYRSYGADGGGGKYGGADDSPAAASRFMDMYIDSNKLNQRSMRNEFDFFDDKNYGANDPFGVEKREKGLNKSITESRDRSDQMKNALYGGANPFGADFTLPEAPDPIKSNAEEIYEKASKKMK
jgi:hypothetical protein